MSKPLIKPQTLKGFRDYLPGPMIAREHLIDTARRVYRSFGFSPIDTPALEYTEILLGKGGEETDKQLFRFTDQGERDVAMRFDLTVPLARFASQHLQEIGTPFKRYHIATVWRAEKPQKGRYREFIQCDFDTIGTDSNVADTETLLVIHDLMEKLGFTRFNIRVNNRLVLNGLLEHLGLTGQTVGVLRALDKLPKIGREAVIAEMTEKVNTTASQADSVLKMTELTGTPAEILDQVETMLAGNEQGMTGVKKLRELFSWAAASGVNTERIALDLSIARGLDYYTGTIYETFLSDLPGIGSVCSGGRYDNLAGLFTSQKLPGVGASLGLDRLLAAMEELGGSEHGLDSGPRVGPALRRGPHGRLSADRPHAAGRRHRDRSLLRSASPRQTARLRESKRLPRRPDRRRNRVRPRRRGKSKTCKPGNRARSLKPNYRRPCGNFSEESEA